MKRPLGVVAAVAAILVAASLVAARLQHRPPPPPLPAFTLTATDGRPVSLAQFRGRTALVYFGYTHCRSGCTAPLASMQHVAAGRPDVAALFVTLDPARDDPAALDAFVGPVAPLAVALTGSTEAVTAAERAFGVYAVRRDTDTGVHFDRSNLIYVVDPLGRIVGHVDGGAPSSILASSIGKPPA